MTREKRPGRAPSESLIRRHRHPCRDTANVRVNDPLAVGIEELRRPLHRNTRIQRRRTYRAAVKDVQL
jgi:hypothetical protein